tara:strand:+ start:379 stop:570 length:192 start_codon:yes stop_codon:yes gene_type:complete
MKLSIESARYQALLEWETEPIVIFIQVTGEPTERGVPIDSGNMDYVEIKRQVDAGTLTIADAD